MSEKDDRVCKGVRCHECGLLTATVCTAKNGTITSECSHCGDTFTLKPVKSNRQGCASWDLTCEEDE